MSDLSGLQAVVTGATGGIGSAVCDRLAADGAAVWALDVKPPQTEPTGTFMQLDVKDPGSVTAVAAQIAQQAGRIDILVAAAGVVEDDVAAEDISPELYDHVMGVNLRGVFLVCQAFGRHMLAQGSGCIVTIASMSGNAVVNRPQRQAVYNASKAGVTALTKSLAAEWGPRGVRVNAVSPGYVDTELLALKKHQHQQWKDGTILGRFATTQEVAAAVSFLAGPDAGYFVGSEILMDGGYSLW